MFDGVWFSPSSHGALVVLPLGTRTMSAVAFFDFGGETWRRPVRSVGDSQGAWIRSTRRTKRGKTSDEMRRKCGVPKPKGHDALQKEGILLPGLVGLLGLVKSIKVTQGMATASFRSFGEVQG